MKLKLYFEAYLLALIVLINTHQGDAKTESSMAAVFLFVFVTPNLFLKFFYKIEIPKI